MKVHYCSYNSMPLVFWARLIQSTTILFLYDEFCDYLPGVSFCQFPYINPLCISDLPHKCIWRHSSIDSLQLLCTKQPLNFSMSCSQNHYVSLVSNEYGQLVTLILFRPSAGDSTTTADTAVPGVSNVQTVCHMWCTSLLYMALSLTLLQLQKWPNALLKYLINFNDAFPLYCSQ